MDCECKFDFSHDNIIEFYEVCEKHNKHFTGFIALIKRIVNEAKKWYD